MEKLCFFIGHRDAPDELMPALCEAIEKHILEYCVSEFIVGHYGQFDKLAANAVIRAKEKYPEVKLTLLLPYHPAQRPIEIPKGFDGSFYPLETENTPLRYRIIKANQAMIRRAEYLITYVRHPASNAGNLAAYAAGRKSPAIHITKL
ncbi:MAG: hypothetical protein IJY28_08510 [Clostridia bacterium]|nr:hypothetical protein [Clostridia bacterium]